MRKLCAIPRRYSMMCRPVTRGGRRRGEDPLKNFSPPVEKCVGYSVKLLDIVQKNRAPLRQMFTPPGVPSWLRAWWCLCCCNRLRLRGGAGQLVYIPVFSLVQVHHERILICDISPLLDTAKAICELPDWVMGNVKFSFQAFSIVSRARMELLRQFRCIQGSTLRFFSRLL